MAEYILQTDSLNDGRSKINASIDASERAETKADDAVSTANLANEKSDDTQAQLNQVVIDGDSSVEAAQARYNSVTDETYPVLADRLDAEYAGVSSQLADKAYKTKVSVNGDVKFIGHRGLSAIAPENTLPAYILAGNKGMWGAETDIQRTLDGHWVLMHDLTVDRMTDGTGNVKDLTLAEIKEMNVDSGVNIGLYPNLKVPTLGEFLSICRQYGLIPILEVKSAFNADDCVDLVNVIKDNGFEESSIVLTADLLILWEIRKHSMRIHAQYLASITQAAIDAVVNMGNASIDAEWSTITQDQIEQAHAMGVKVNAWTINNYSDARILIGYGLDMVTTDAIIDLKVGG